MALHRSGSYLFLSSLFAFFFPSIAACRHSVTFFSSFSSLLLLISPLSPFLFYSSIFSHLWRHPYFPKHLSPFSFPPFPRSVLIFIPFPIVFRSSPLLSSLQLHDPSKFKYLATSCQKVASMDPTARGGSRVLSVIVNFVPIAFQLAYPCFSRRVCLPMFFLRLALTSTSLLRTWSSERDLDTIWLHKVMISADNGIQASTVCQYHCDSILPPWKKIQSWVTETDKHTQPLFTDNGVPNTIGCGCACCACPWGCLIDWLWKKDADDLSVWKETFKKK